MKILLDSVNGPAQWLGDASGKDQFFQIKEWASFYKALLRSSIVNSAGVYDWTTKLAIIASSAEL